MNRKTAKDYKNQYTDLNNKLSKLSNEVTERLMFLCKSFPDAPIGRAPDLDKTIILAKSLIDQKFYVENLPLHNRIHYIEIIETYTKSLENVQQLTLNL